MAEGAASGTGADHGRRAGGAFIQFAHDDDSRSESGFSEASTVVRGGSAADPRKQKAIDLYNKELNDKIIFRSDDATLFVRTFKNHQSREEGKIGPGLLLERRPSEVYGEDFSSWPRNKPILTSAAMFGRTKIVLTLIEEFKCDINVKRAEDSNTALHLAGYYGHDETVDALLKMGADCLSPNKYGESPQQAVQKGAQHWLKGEKKHKYEDPFFVCFRKTGRKPEHTKCDALLLAHIQYRKQEEQAPKGLAGAQAEDGAGAAATECAQVYDQDGRLRARIDRESCPGTESFSAAIEVLSESMQQEAWGKFNWLLDGTQSSITIAGNAVRFGPSGTRFEPRKAEIFLPIDRGLLEGLRQLEVPFSVGAFRWNEGEKRWEEKHRVAAEDATGEDLRVEAESFSIWVAGLVSGAYARLKRKLKVKTKPKASGHLASPVGQQPPLTPTAEQAPLTPTAEQSPRALFEIVEEEVGFRWDDGMAVVQPPKFAFKPAAQAQDLDVDVFIKSTIEIVGMDCPLRSLKWNTSLLQRSPSALGTPREGSYNKQQAIACTPASKPRIEVFACKVGSDVDVFWEAKKIEESLAQSGDFYVHSRPLPSAEDLRDIMSLCKRDNIIGIHFAGHTGEGGGVVLEGEIEGFMASIAKELSKRSFVEQISLGTKSTLRFVFLNACDGLGLARRLVERGVFYVVCWMHAVNDESALLFCDRFYRWLKNNPGEYGSAFRSAAVDHPASIRARPCLLWRDREMKGAHLDKDWVCLEGAEGAYVWADDEFQFLSKVEVGTGEPSLLPSSEEEDVGEEEYEGGADGEGEDSEMRNWRPPTQDNDFAALAGQKEQECLKALGFDLRLSDKPISIGNGILDNGFITDDVLRKLGVQSYGALWGPSGAAVNKAFELLLVQQDERDAAAGRVERAVSHLKGVERLRQKDIDKHQAKPKKDQKKHEGHVHQLRKVQASARAMMGLLAGKKEMDVLLALGFPVETREYMDSKGVLAKATLQEIGSNSFTQVCSARAETRALQLLKSASGAGAKGSLSGSSGVERVERAVRLLEEICDNDIRLKKQMVQMKECSETLKQLLRQHATVLAQ